MIDMTQYPGPEGAEPPPGVEPAPPLQALTWTVLTEGRWSLVVTKETGSVAASLSPIEHALSDNREYLIGALKDGWWLALEVDGQITTLASPFPSEEAAKRPGRGVGGRPQVSPLTPMAGWTAASMRRTDLGSGDMMLADRLVSRALLPMALRARIPACGTSHDQLRGPVGSGSGKVGTVTRAFPSGPVSG